MSKEDEMEYLKEMQPLNAVVQVFDQEGKVTEENTIKFRESTISKPCGKAPYKISFGQPNDFNNQSKLTTYEEALKFYGDKSNYMDEKFDIKTGRTKCTIVKDMGDRATKALKEGDE